MVARNRTSNEMIANNINNINNIMRTKLNLTPQMLSKNTNEIVSACIGKIYQQMPNKFRNGLQKIKVATPKLENRGPLRMLKIEEQKELAMRVPSNATSLSNNEKDLLKTVMKASRRKNLMGMKGKVLKSPNFRIYSNRRFGSSQSSSSGSLYRRMDERRRSKNLGPKFSTKKPLNIFHASKHVYLEPNLTAILEPARNQQMRRSAAIGRQKPLEINSSVYNDLMAINDIVKERLRVTGPKVQSIKKPDLHSIPLQAELVRSRNEQIYAHKVLQEQFNRLQSIADIKPTLTYSQREKLSTTTPSLSSNIIRKRFAHLYAKPVETLQPQPAQLAEPNTTSLQYFSKREPIQASPDVKVSTDGNSTPKIAQYIAPKNISQQNKSYKIVGRIGSRRSPTISRIVSPLSPIGYSRINYLNLSAPPN